MRSPRRRRCRAREGNNNGCTELSATPPEDLQPVPPNIVLMLDDSGSMGWDFMPDWGVSREYQPYGTRNSGINGVYYNPATTYTPPPKATATGTVWQSDGTLVPEFAGHDGAYYDGFTNPAANEHVEVCGYRSRGRRSLNYRLLVTTWSTTTIHPNPRHPSTRARPSGEAAPRVVPGARQSRARRRASARLLSIRSGQSSPMHSRSRCSHRQTGRAIREMALVNSGGKSISATTTCGRTESGNVDTAVRRDRWGTEVSRRRDQSASDSLCHYPAMAPTPATAGNAADRSDSPTPNYMWICPSGSTFTGSSRPPEPSPRVLDQRTHGHHDNTAIYVWAFTYVVGNPSANEFALRDPQCDVQWPGPPAGGWCTVLNELGRKT